MTRAYDSDPLRCGLRHRGILPVISRRGVPEIHGLGKIHYVVEQIFVLLHQFKGLVIH
ncbi:hypothetical protein ABT218_11120 [Streptomyces sp. NPDC001455]|uniref:hypothetical protein n=1 Tax=Streptomyces sp. NPDC001455 TaxID=3154518 RepID=UPI0033238E9F